MLSVLTSVSETETACWLVRIWRVASFSLVMASILRPSVLTPNPEPDHNGITQTHPHATESVVPVS